MKLKKTFMACLLMFGFLSASAQDQQPKIEYVHNPYWYVQAQVGGQYTLGEIDFKDLLSPNVQVAVGRQFSPVFGLRLAVNAWQSRAGIKFNPGGYSVFDGQGNETFVYVPGGTTKWKWMYVAPGIDATFNLSNLFCGFNPNRLFNFTVFAGLGANIGWGMDKEKNWTNYDLAVGHYATTFENTLRTENLDYVWQKTKVRLYGRVGIAGDFKINDKISVGLEVNANTLSDRYNGKRAGNSDWYFNALAGVKVNLGKTYTTRTIEAPKAPEKIIEKVIERVIEKPAAQPAPAVAPTHALAKKEDKFRRDVFFQINKTQINQLKASERQKVKEVAEYLKANPNAKVEVTGYADVGTGNPKINKTLSQRRAQAVYNALVRTYKIKASRIKVDSKGDTIQPFAKEEENRVVICIAD
jgi:outer membrane protein OmpA-like peptidoglycan-associated protein